MGEVRKRAREGDLVVTMGAPPISLMGDELLAALAERARERLAAEGVLADVSADG